MSIRKISFAPGEYYHIYNRGNSKQKIFLNGKDYDRFLKLIFLCNSSQNINFRDLFETHKDVFTFDRGDTLVDIGAYCLMPNHFHLLVREKADGNISLFMQKLSTAYVMYFNKKHDRSGSLFEGKFKSQHASSDKHLRYLFSYIHLNPVKLVDSKWRYIGVGDKNKAYDFCKRYPYSSIIAFTEEGSNVILNISVFPKYFVNSKEYRSEVFEWLDFPLGKT